MADREKWVPLIGTAMFKRQVCYEEYKYKNINCVMTNTVLMLYN